MTNTYGGKHLTFEEQVELFEKHSYVQTKQMKKHKN